MSLRREVRQLVQSMLVAAFAPEGVTLVRLIPANDSGPRPTSSYLSIRVLSIAPIASADDVRTVSGSDVLQSGRQVRDARVALQAFGDAAVAWLEVLNLRLGWPSVLAVAVARETSAPRDLTSFVDTDFEARAESEIGLYLDAVDAESDTLIPAATVGLDILSNTFILQVE